MIRASDLYDWAECAHRIALDRKLERERRAPVDPTTSWLLEHGLEHERQIVSRLGYPTPNYPKGDFAAGAAITQSWMAQGLAGIAQAVLIDCDRLAIADLVERVEGTSVFGPFHYQPGDIKSGFTTRADYVYQIGFAGKILGRLQQRAPQRGFVIRGDGSREEFELAAIDHVLDAAITRTEQILRGEVKTEPFFSHACRRCRWRNVCRETLDDQHLSRLDGMTRARQRALQRAGVQTIRELASGSFDRSPIEFRIERLIQQARAASGLTPSERRDCELPAQLGQGLVVIAERSPLQHELPVLIGWRPGTCSPATIAITADRDDRSRALAALEQTLETHEGPWVCYGSRTIRALEIAIDEAGWSPARQRRWRLRGVDLAPLLRRVGPVFPVHRYDLDSIAAVLRGEAPPDPFEPGEELFALVERQRRNPSATNLEQLTARAELELDRRLAVLHWCASRS